MILYDDTEPYRSIAQTMRRFTFTRPVEAGDLEYVAAALRAVSPGCVVSVRMPWPDVVGVQVVDGLGLAVFTREYVAVPPR